MASTASSEISNVNIDNIIIPQNSGLRSVAPPPEFQNGFGTNQANVALPDFRIFTDQTVDRSNIDDSIFTGETALTPNRKGPTGDGYGPPIFPGVAIPPPVPAVSIGGSAAGIPPYWISETTLKPSALFNILQKADLGFNQAITHFEQGTPIEAAAIDILEVALGSQKLDSQAKLLGHIDRAIGIDNLQRIQRWANTGGALDALKEQIVKIAKNYGPPDNLFPTIPPQLQYLFSSNGKRR
ncbi:unnamed protein product [Dracunculus medinensis]|uniref:Uncharacterized protein n=1 Tax=Dracunculus medinensis TaxID=318479 RepID=A0A3P7SI87_DRAME|nr:unnamed protein product [Dracunculus medinensis]